MRKFWYIILKPFKRKELTNEKVIKILTETQFIGMDGDCGKAQKYYFTNQLKVSDIVLVMNRGPLALVEVLGASYKEPSPNSKLDWFEIRRKVKILQFYDPEIGKKIGKRKIDIFFPYNSIFDSADDSKFIKKWFLYCLDNMLNYKVKNLLEYKKQIILQGPPGTGKTRLAKEIAKELTLPKDFGSIQQKIENFFRSFKSNDSKVNLNREEMETLLSEFQSTFPKDNLNKLTLEDYCIGTGTKDNFCYWIERKLKPLGYYFPGSSRSYLIYWSQSENQYKTHFQHSDFLSFTDSTDEAMKNLSTIIYDFVNDHEKYNLKSLPFGWGFILKVLHSYYPDKYFPTNGAGYMSNILKLLGIKSQGQNTYELNQLIQEYFLQKKEQYKLDIKNYEFMNFLDKEFDLKGHIELQSDKVVSKGKYKLVQFHPAYSYEDFVRGISVEINETGQPVYTVVNRIIGEFAQKAVYNPSKNYVLIIDEINRANLASVLGELIYALEYRFDKDDVEGTTVESIYALKSTVIDEELEGNKLMLPKNLFIIGTMNTADRSVSHIDYAIRRRFAFVDLQPSEGPLHEVIKDHRTLKKALDLFWKVSDLFRNDFMNPDFKAEEVRLGHSYFMGLNEAELKLKLDYEIKPLLKEYIKDGILTEKANEEVEKLSV